MKTPGGTTPRRGLVQRASGGLYLGAQRCNAGVACVALGTTERRASARRLQPAHGDARDDQPGGCAQCWGKRREPDACKRLLGRGRAADQEQPPHLEQPRVRGITMIAVVLERRTRGVERPAGPAELARGERDLGFGHDASGARNRIGCTECVRGAPEERPRSLEVAELRHRDAA